MKAFVALAFFLALFCGATASAATCTVHGTIDVEPMSFWYCRTGVTDCSGWNQVDLDTAVKPLAHMAVMIVDPVSGYEFGRTKTDSNGWYSITFSDKPSCTGPVWLRITYDRVHENGSAGVGPYRFYLMDNDVIGYNYNFQRDLTGSVTNITKHYLRTTSQTVTWPVKLANIYYIASAAIDEMKLWSASVDSRMMYQWIHYEPDNPQGNRNGFDNFGKEIYIGDYEYNNGDGLRHELGHQVLVALHHDNKDPGDCMSPFYGNSMDDHQTWTCEWGSLNMEESLSTFFAVRSITSSDANVWLCYGSLNNQPNLCANSVLNAGGTLDRVIDVPGDGLFWGIGDNYAWSRDHCFRLRDTDSFCSTCTGTSCTTCPDIKDGPTQTHSFPSGDDICDNYAALGFRNEIDTVRYLWDIVDTHNEGNEATDESITSLAAKIEAMTCPSSGGYGAEASCREPLRANASQCVPSSVTGGAIIPMQGTRDSYNQWDYGDMLPGDQTGARLVNCVDGAGD